MAYDEISDGWGEATAMAALGDKLYIIDRGTLYQVDASGEQSELNDGWDEATHMTAMGGALWIIDRGTLYRVDPASAGDDDDWDDDE